MPATASKKRSVTSKAKAVSNKKAAAKATNGAGRPRRSQEATLELANKIKAARDAGTSWGDIKAKLGVDPAQGQFLIKIANVKPKDKIKFSDDKDLAKLAKALRADGISKAEIAARAGTSVGHIRKVLAEPAGKRAKVTTGKAKTAPAKAAKAGDAAKSGDAAPRRRRRKRAEGDVEGVNPSTAT